MRSCKPDLHVCWTYRQNLEAITRLSKHQFLLTKIQRAINERQLAENICKVHGKSLVDDNGKSTIDGATLGDLYFNQWSKAGYDVKDGQMALRHWVLAAGYNRQGEFQYRMSNHILNC